MKIKPQTEALAKVLDLAGRAVKSNATVPVLSAVLVEADKESSTLAVSSTDTELAIRVVAGGCEVDEGGKAAIRAGLLASVVKSLPEAEAEIEADGSRATLTTGTGSYAINAYNAADFPKLPEFPAGGAGGSFTVPARELAGAIEKVLPFTARDELRPILTGVLVTFEDDALTMAATDSYRLGVARKKLAAEDPEVENTPQEKVSQIIPARALREVVRLAALTEKVEVSITANQAMFHARGVTIATRLIDGSFPEYERLLPPSFERAYRVERAPLMAALKRVNLFCGRANPPAPVRLSFTSGQESLMGDELIIAGASPEVGAAREAVPFTGESPDERTAEQRRAEGAVDRQATEFAAAFNPHYLLDSVANAGAEEVVFKFNGPLKPAMVFPAGQGEDEPEVRMLLMPMRDPYAEEAPAREPKPGEPAGEAAAAAEDAATT